MIALPPTKIVQIAFVVANLGEGIQRWVRTTGAGPFFVIERPVMQNPLYLGKPCNSDYAVAAGYLGSMQIELIEVRNDVPSIFSALIAQRGEGYHHFMPVIDDFDATVARYAREGCPVVFSGTAPGIGRIAFADGTAQFGSHIEIVEPSPLIKQMHEVMRNAALDWDGSDPVRAFPLA